MLLKKWPHLFMDIPPPFYTFHIDFPPPPSFLMWILQISSFANKRKCSISRQYEIRMGGKQWSSY